MTRMIRRLAAGTALAFAAGATVVAAAPAASAGGCTGPLCSETTNETSHIVGTAKDWCDGNHGPCNGTAYGLLHKNETTPGGQDWDTFFVSQGCTYSGIKHSWGIGFSESGGSNGKWVQVYNDEHYYIKKVTC